MGFLGSGCVLRMPRDVWDIDNGWPTPEYRFHYYFEVFQHGNRWTTDLFSEDIVYRDLEYVDNTGWVTNICIYWSVGDWTAPVYSPMEDPRFPTDSERPPRAITPTGTRSASTTRRPRCSTRWTGHTGGRPACGAHVVERSCSSTTSGECIHQRRRARCGAAPDGPAAPDANYWEHYL